MPKLKKSIVPEGSFLASKPDGSRILKNFPLDFLKQVVTNTNKMISLGLKIPVPFAHNEDALPNPGSTENLTYNNAGYWDELSIEKDANDNYVLFGVADVPGDVEDYESPAGKLMHRVKEISGCFVDSYRDGLDRLWGPSMLHGAAVLHPIVPGQDGWTQLSFPSDDCYILSASLILDQQDPSGSISDLAKSLADNAGIYLPPNTSANDLVKVLLIAVKQLSMSKVNDDDTHVVDTQSVFMSQPKGKLMAFTTKQAEEFVALGFLDPQTNEPVKLDDMKQHINDTPPVDEKAQREVDVWMSSSKALYNQYSDQLKDGLRKRVETLVKHNSNLKAHADEKLYPAIDAVQLSVDKETSKIIQPAIAETISALEAITPEPSTPALPSPADWFNVPTGSTTHEGLNTDAEDPNPPMTDDERASMEKEFMSFMSN